MENFTGISNLDEKLENSYVYLRGLVVIPSKLKCRFLIFFFELQVKPMVIKNPHMATLHHHPHHPHTGTATLHLRTVSQPMEVMLPMINNYFSLLT